MLIVEGADLVGKTTLCEELMRRLPGWCYAHLGPEANHAEWHSYWGYRRRASRRVVQDRFHMSQVAYAWARREEPAVTPYKYALVDAFLREIGGFTVVITASLALLEDRFVRAELYALATIARANNAFMGFGRASHECYERADVDLHIHCTPDSPWVEGVLVDFIIDRYTRRQAELDELIRAPTPYVTL